MWHTLAVTPDQARERLRKLADDRDRADAAEGPAVLAAMEAGVAQKDIAADLRRSREHVRRVARAHQTSKETPDA